MLKSNLPVVDVIILSWNRTEATLEAIDSVLQQRGVIPRVWVVDQGSNEASLQALRELDDQGKIFLTELGYNVGSCAGRNIASAQGKADYIVGLDNDAMLETPDTLAYIVKRFEQDADVGLIGFRIKNYYSGGDDMMAWATYPRGFYDWRDKEFMTTRYVAAGYAIRRSILRDGANYDPALFFFCEEQDLALQVIHRGYKVIYDPRAAVLHKVDPEARANWNDSRYYYLARNSIYLHHKFYQSNSRTILMMAGYLARGLANRVPRQSIRALWDAFGMIRNMKQEKFVHLSETAKEYIYSNDTKYRGTIWQRARRDIVRPLNPPSSTETA